MDKSKKYYIHTIILFVIMFGFGFLPSVGTITPLGMKVLGVFLGMLYGWCFIEMLWPSLIGLVALGLSGYCPIQEAFIAGFGDNIVLILFLTLILSVFFEESGFSSWIADWLLSRKILIGRPWIFTTVFLFTSYIACLFIGAFAAPIILWSVFYKLCDRVGFKRGDQYVSIIIFGTVFASLASMQIFPWKVLAVMVIGMAGVAIEPLKYFVIQFILSLLLVIGYILACRFIIRPNIAPLKTQDDLLESLRGQKMTKKQAGGGIVLLIFIAIMFLPSILPKTWALTAILSNIGIIGGAAILLVALAIIRKKDGTRMISISEYIKKGVAWDLLFLMAGTFPVAAAMEAESTGIVAFVVTLISNAFDGVSPMVFILTVVVILALLSQVMHNLVLLIVFVPVIAKLCVVYGANPAVFVMLVLLACQIALCTPGASANAAMIFGNEWITTKHAYQLGFITTVLNILILVCIGYPLANMILS